MATDRKFKYVKGVIYAPEFLGIPENNIKDKLRLKNATVIDAYRLTKWPDDHAYPLIVITFSGKKLPEKVVCGYINYTVRRFQFYRCSKCQCFGHIKFHCNSTLRCGKCSELHETFMCESKQFKCSNCFGKHPSYSKKCPTYQNEFELYFFHEIGELQREHIDIKAPLTQPLINGEQVDKIEKELHLEKRPRKKKEKKPITNYKMAKIEYSNYRRRKKQKPINKAQELQLKFRRTTTPNENLFQAILQKIKHSNQITTTIQNINGNNIESMSIYYPSLRKQTVSMSKTIIDLCDQFKINKEDVHKFREWFKVGELNLKFRNDKENHLKQMRQIQKKETIKNEKEIFQNIEKKYERKFQQETKLKEKNKMNQTKKFIKIDNKKLERRHMCENKVKIINIEQYNKILSMLDEKEKNYPNNNIVINFASSAHLLKYIGIKKSKKK